MAFRDLYTLAKHLEIISKPAEPIIGLVQRCSAHILPEFLHVFSFPLDALASTNLCLFKSMPGWGRPC